MQRWSYTMRRWCGAACKCKQQRYKRLSTSVPAQPGCLAHSAAHGMMPAQWTDGASPVACAGAAVCACVAWPAGGQQRSGGQQQRLVGLRLLLDPSHHSAVGQPASQPVVRSAQVPPQVPHAPLRCMPWMWSCSFAGPHHHHASTAWQQCSRACSACSPAMGLPASTSWLLA